MAFISLFKFQIFVVHHFDTLDLLTPSSVAMCFCVHSFRSTLMIAKYLSSSEIAFLDIFKLFYENFEINGYILYITVIS